MDDVAFVAQQLSRRNKTFVYKAGYFRSPMTISVGAGEGSLACSTCHFIGMDMEYYNNLEDPTDEENDMLDSAFGLTEKSNLGWFTRP